ncbi:Hypothetical protein, putative [Bodo saltans]|uniref:Uncharacterized protein n=1 Tax=Bodo saltans TaxID=75058 RepID=A0A0S4JA42_BODSA|nr:Hypothetical protein, putative [Bodo saltans]|eukprot:CUG87070.1 Hypothetical protein, putative [Bodo saltans]
MHCLRAPDASTPGRAPQSGGTRFASDRSLRQTSAVLQDLESPTKVTNNTGIFLDGIGTPLEIRMVNGKTALQGTTFRDRLLPPTIVVPPVSTQSRRFRKGGGGAAAIMSSSAVARPPLSISTVAGGSLVRSNTGGGSALLDDEGLLQSARSTGSSSLGASSGATFTATPTTTMSQQRRSAEESGTAGGATINGGEGFASIDTFFQRMRQDLRDFRRVDTAEMGRQYLAEVATRMAAAAESHNGGGGGASRSSSSQLSPWIRVDTRRRTNTNEIFQSLQKPALTDITRPDVKRYLQNRERKYHQNVQLIYEPAKLLLEAVWDQHRVSKKKRAEFMELYFDGVGDIVSYDAISRELERYHQTVSEIDIELMRQVSLREAHIAELKVILDNAPHSLSSQYGRRTSSSLSTTATTTHQQGSSLEAPPSRPGSSASSFKSSASTMSDNDGSSTRSKGNESAFVMSVLNCICLLRYNTCMIVDLVQQKRGALDIDQKSSAMRPSKESTELANKLRDAKTKKQHQQQQHNNTLAAEGPHSLHNRPPSPAAIQQRQGHPGGAMTVTTVAAAEDHYRLIWEGSNYLIVMQHDLDFLQHTVLQQILDPAHYRLLGNPFILPNALLNVCQVRNESVKNHTMPLSVAATNRGILRALRGGTDRLQRVGVDDDASSAGTRSVLNGGGAMPPPGRSSTPTSFFRDQEASPAPPPRPSTSMSLNASSSTKSSHNRKSPLPSSGTNGRIILLREGEEVTVTSAAASMEESTLSASGMSRDQFFAKLRKEELLRTRRIPMDRSNVYQYPSAVYHTTAESPWVALSHRLRRSLDPRIPSKPYDDVAEFEILQFGRLTVPPSQAHPYNDPMVDQSLDCIRSVLSEVPSWSQEELMRRDIIIFGEDTVVLKATAHAKLHRGLARFRMAYRGFVASMQTRRLAAITGGDENAAARGFVDWVERFAPQWMNEVSTALLENDADSSTGAAAAGDQSSRRIAQAMKERFSR